MAAGVDLKPQDELSPATRRGISPGRPPATAVAEREAHLLAVASEEFLARGYEGASMGRIARTAGVSPKTIYARYANKDELLLAVVADLTAESRTGVAEKLSKPSLGLEQALTTIALAMASAWTSEREIELYRLVISESVRFPNLAHLYRKSVEEFRAMILSYLTSKAGQGVLVIDDVEVAAFQFSALVMCELRERMLLGEQPSPDEARETAKQAVALFLNGYRPRSPDHA